MKSRTAAGHLWTITLLAFGVLLAGCMNAPQGVVTVPVIPAWVPPAAHDTFTASDVIVAVQAAAPGAAVLTSDRDFTVVDHAWMESMVRWSWDFLMATGWEYTAESFDCEDFAGAFVLGCKRSAARAGVKVTPLVARISVFQREEFAGVKGSATALHALVGFYSERGLFVLEPQPSGVPRLVKLADYPNRIFEVDLRG